MRLGREETRTSPSRSLVISASLPSATIEAAGQVTTRIETKLEELDKTGHTRSSHHAGAGDCLS